MMKLFYGLDETTKHWHNQQAAIWCNFDTIKPAADRRVSRQTCPQECMSYS